MTFFSGTDQSTLKEEGSDKNVFVSLIVNNAGKYTAGITRKVTYTTTTSNASYASFNNEQHMIDSMSEPKTYTEVEWYDLKVVTEYEAIAAEMEKWTQDTLAKKPASKVNATTLGYKPVQPVAAPASSYYSAFRKDEKKDDSKPWYEKWQDDEEKLFPSEQWKGYSYGGAQYKSGADIPISKIKETNRRMLLGNLILPDNNKIDVKQWIKDKSVKIYKERVGSDSDIRIWFEWLVEQVIDFDFASVDATQEEIVEALLEDLNEYDENIVTESLKRALEDMVISRM